MTMTMNGDGGAGPYDDDRHSNVADGEGTGGAEVETVVNGAIPICLDRHKCPPPTLLSCRKSSEFSVWPERYGRTE